ncbi:MAG: iron ABC transporter permease [Acidimicrobiia bacterium]|nr:iron ABC transporter permease [Acidimicrobiia bacterium]
MFADRPAWLVAVVGVVTTVVVAVIAVSVGTVAISPADSVRVLADRLLPLDVETDSIADPIIWNIRFPRVVAALGVGASLGLAGAVLQGLFRNPVADPQLVGLSSIGSVGVLLGAWIGWDLWGPIAGVVGGAVVGALGAGFVRVLARNSEGDPSRFILAGIGFGVAVAAVVATASVALNDPRIPDIPFWFVGGLAASTWGTALWATLFAAAAFVVVYPFAGRLDILSLGTASARHLGVDVNLVFAVTLAAIGMATGASVGAAGVIGFVGLMAGHISRSLVGEHHDHSLVAAVFVGAILVVAADAFGRVVGGRFEIPVGLVMAFVGGPYLVWLITTRRAAA